MLVRNDCAAEGQQVMFEKMADKNNRAKPWQYSLRALFVIMTVVALWAALWQRNTDLAINLAIAAGFVLLPELLFWIVRRRFR